MSDEQVIDKMRKLGQNLDRWVTSNFKDAQRLAAFVAKPEVEFPRTPSQKRASIQASIAVLISRRIFAPYYFGVADEGGKIFADIEESVGQTCMPPFPSLFDLSDRSQAQKAHCSIGASRLLSPLIALQQTPGRLHYQT